MGKLDEILERLTKIEVLLSERDKQCAAHVERIAKLEHAINGNGQAGIAEEVRNLKTRWALLVTGGSMLVSGLIHFIPEIAKLLAKKIGG